LFAQQQWFGHGANAPLGVPGAIRFCICEQAVQIGIVDAAVRVQRSISRIGRVIAGQCRVDTFN
jgi:hypothetical protein